MAARSRRGSGPVPGPEPRSSGEPPGPAPRATGDCATLVRFMALAACGGITVGLAQMTVSLQALRLGASASQIGLIGGVPNVGVLTTVLPMGFLVDRFGPRKMFTIGALAGAVGYVLMARVGTPDALLLAVSVAALFLSFRFVSLNSVFLEYLREAGSARAGWYRGSHSIGMAFVGPLLGSLLVERVGCGATFLVVSALLLLTVALASRVLGGRGAARGAASLREVLGSVGSLLRNEEVLEASIFEGVAVMAVATLNAFAPVVAMRELGLSSREAAGLLATHGAVFIVALFSMESVLRRVGRARFYLVSSALAAVGLGILGAARTSAVLWSGAVFLGAGLGMLNIVNVSRLSGVEVQKGRVSGVFSLFTMTGAIVGPLLGGVVGEILRPQAAYLVLVPAFALLALRVVARTGADAAPPVPEEP